jgi:L-lysine 2,3-aminomutase
MRRASFGDHISTREMYIQQSPEVRDILLNGWRNLIGDTRAIDQHINSTKLINHELYERVDLRFIGHIAAQT